jgi:hypothetical protein
MKPPRIQIILDAQGERLVLGHLHRLINLVVLTIGSDKLDQCFWITTYPLRHDFEYRFPEAMRTNAITAEKFHADSMDLYLQGEVVPVGRIVNLAEPKEPA